MRETEGEIELLALERGLEADALDLEFLGVAEGNALDHAGDDAAGGAVHGPGEARLLQRRDGDLLVGQGDFHHRGEGLGDLALRALDVDGVVLGVDLDLFGNGNGLFADAAHGGGLSLPDVAEELAAGLVAAAILVFHQTLGGGNDGDAKAVEDPGDLRVAIIKAAAGGRNAVEPGDGGRALHVLEFDDESLVSLLVRAVGVVRDVALGLEDAGEAFLEDGVRNDALLEAGLAGVAQAGEKISDRIGHVDVDFIAGGSYPTPAGGEIYQEDLITPGIFPESASSRKVRRETPNLPM